MKLSSHSDIHWFIIRPKDGGVVTKRDQKNLGKMFKICRPSFVAIHFASKNKSEEISRISGLKLSKPMVVTEVTDAQWANRFKLEETIEGTGIHATKCQIDSSFTI